MTTTIADSATGSQDGGGSTLALTIGSTEGNLQVAYTMERSGPLTPAAPTGSGWSAETKVDVSGGTRRAVHMWWRVVPASASTTVTLDNDSDLYFVGMIYEFTTTLSNPTWTFDASTPTTGGLLTSLASGSVTPANDEAVAIDALVWRYGTINTEDSYNSSFTAGIGASQGVTSGDVSGALGYRIVNVTPAAMSTTASWSTSANASSLMTVFSVVSGMTLEQEGSRWRTDAGNEATPTWEAAQDTDVTMPAGVTKGLRALVNAVGDPPADAYKIQFRRVGDADSELEDLA